MKEHATDSLPATSEAMITDATQSEGFRSAAERLRPEHPVAVPQATTREAEQSAADSKAAARLRPTRESAD